MPIWFARKAARLVRELRYGMFRAVGGFRAEVMETRGIWPGCVFRWIGEGPMGTTPHGYLLLSVEREATDDERGLVWLRIVPRDWPDAPRPARLPRAPR